MSNWKTAFTGAIAAVILTLSVAVHSQQPSAKAPQPGRKTGGSEVQSIVLPKYPPEIAPGPHVEVYSKNCLLCHSGRYVSMQPRFSKAVWQNEVKKMVDAYGAPVSEADQALIVEYLVAVKGVEAPARAATPPK